ncbi:unnamed protein product [Rangifer tarandus platyrhynchus]|uniref:Uncharacterized protein n=2 Tax=Rangifer tarandus platyrhynchus TaxID=3082113 RepID=A0AC59Y6V8_RANTA|nr:unnamed protein product [Rangifer tarandus platyrhynchus]
MCGSFLDRLGPRGGGTCPWPSLGQSVDSQSGSKLPAQHGGGEGEVRNRGTVLLNWVPRGSWWGLGDIEVQREARKRRFPLGQLGTGAHLLKKFLDFVAGLGTLAPGRALRGEREHMPHCGRTPGRPCEPGLGGGCCVRSLRPCR